MAEVYLTESKPRTETVKKLSDLAGRANKDDIGKALATLFVKPYVSLPVSVEFSLEMNGLEVPEWLTRFDEEHSRILLQPLSVCHYIQRMRNIQLAQENAADFVRWRNASFLHEMAKLPSIHLLFMIVLQRVAYMLEIAHLEKRGGVIEVAEGESYHTLLWAFKEVEAFVLRTSGVQVRAHYGISWYESDWITGR
jgi:hypothetical protein